MAASDVIRELLVRYLDLWTPNALRSAHGVTFAMVWKGAPDADLTRAAIGTFGEFTDRMKSGRLTVLLIADDTTALTEATQTREFDVHAVQGFDKWPAAFKAAGAPTLTYLDSPEIIDEKNEMFIKTTIGDWEQQRRQIRGPLTAGVDLIADDGETRIAFVTKSAKSLEAFKNELWAVDEFAGVKLRDPRDPDGRLMDISLQPDPAALKGELLARLKTREATVTELKQYTMTDTIYRAADATRAIQALLKSQQITRSPQAGKLGGDVTLALAG